jgi:hypothetical protein
MITENDKQLIHKAWAMHHSQWDVVLTLATQTDTAEAKQQIVDIARIKYHTDQVYNDET